MSVNKRPMIRIAYWLTLMAGMILPAQATVPSGTLPPQCANLIDSDLLLGCYLNDSSNAQIASSIVGLPELERLISNAVMAAMACYSSSPK